MTERLFVYGTLMPGRCNENYLAAIPGAWMKGFVRGIHFPEGYGATAGYPVLVPANDAPPVPGFIFEADFTDAHWQTLDDFETDAYERRLLPVVTGDGTQLNAYVYVLNRADVARLCQELPDLASL
ncbi:MAG: gamma-glutamylcyclotransferase [Proteobacteria bacterium]|jgi:gamma-glutamylcyclotransferase (GGCT)/AIG2-like uncharacterized protein YtfP|nr:gamma-glutamylcyclotransferase [Pseudomonadota bacterium]MDA1301092.1 gamma-glutamylcyclotransferase [Pseudomonadota bacterium]